MRGKVVHRTNTLLLLQGLKRGAGLAAFAVSSICDNFFAPDVA